MSHFPNGSCPNCGGKILGDGLTRVFHCENVVAPFDVEPDCAPFYCPRNEIKYVIGNATQPEGGGNRIIAHICNDKGGWGEGFVLALSARDKNPERQYRDWSHNAPINPFTLGKVQITSFTDDPRLWVANMIAQRGYKNGPDGVPLSYSALVTCLIKLRITAQTMQPPASVHMPRIGCGLGGGEWKLVEKLVNHFLSEHGVEVTVYDLP